MSEEPKLGPTGRFPEGKMNAQDEGELAIGIAADKTSGQVVMNFGVPVSWLGFPPEQAVTIASTLCKKARELGLPVAVTIEIGGHKVE